MSDEEKIQMLAHLSRNAVSEACTNCVNIETKRWCRDCAVEKLKVFVKETMVTTYA